MKNSALRNCGLILVLALSACRLAAAGEPKLLERAGGGALYELNGHRVAILSGSPEQMGRQHGTLLRNLIRDQVNTILALARAAADVRKGGPSAATVETAWERCEPFIPGRYVREMDALADAAGVPRRDVRLANVFPELFHCSGFALMGRASVGGELLHGRVLDYMTNLGLQARAVTFICLPDGRNAFVNVGYAGFIGSVSGMNEKRLAFGEMGGGGVGLWDGMPMGFLMRKGLEEADTLEDAVRLFRETPRTCEYYYVISDGKSRRAVGLRCTPDEFETVNPGEAHPLLPTPLPDAVLLSAGERYRKLVRRVEERYGRIDAGTARDLMKQPVAMESNLHCVLFAPERLTLWVAHAADPSQKAHFQACNQPYVRLEMTEWLVRAAGLEGGAAAVAKPAETRLPAVPEQLEGTGRDAARPPLAPAQEPALAPLLEAYRLPRSEFPWTANLLSNTRHFAVYALRFPSPVETQFEGNNTVHCEYYRVHGKAPRPAVVVLHILEGSFVVARLLCSTLANSGVDALMLKLPFYGERRPAEPVSVTDDPRLCRRLIMQGVADVRRASALLAGLEHVPDDRVGLCGVSLGGFIAALASGVDGSYRRAVFVLAGGGLSSVVATWAAQRAGVGEGLAAAGLSGEGLAEFLRPIDPLTFAHRLKGCDVIMLNVTGDEVVPRACAERLAHAAGDKPIIWYQGGSHTAMALYVFDVLRKVTAHFTPDAW